jgi:signal peptidase
MIHYMQQNMKKNVLLIVVLAVALFAIYMGSSPLRALTVSGNSMTPLITQADMIVVAPVDQNNLNLHVGNIITYKREIDGTTVLITHRIVEINDNGFRTKGDSMDEIDPYVVKPTESVGVMKFKIPYLGSFLRFANTTPGFILLIIVPATLIIAIEIKIIIRYKYGEKEK